MNVKFFSDLKRIKVDGKHKEKVPLTFDGVTSCLHCKVSFPFIRTCLVLIVKRNRSAFCTKNMMDRLLDIWDCTLYVLSKI